MGETLSIGVLGATGVLGSEIVQLLPTSKIGFSEVSLFASKDSIGEYYRIGEEEVEVEEFRFGDLDGIDIMFVATPYAITRELITEISDLRAQIIDLSGAFSNEECSVLCAPNILKAFDPTKRVYVVPRSYSYSLGLILHAISSTVTFDSVSVQTYHSVANAGKIGLDELWNQTKSVFSQQSVEQEAFVHQIAFNTVPITDVMLQDGKTKEEHGIEQEIKNLLNRPNLELEVMAVRVPVFHGDGAVVTITSEQPLILAEIISALNGTSGIVVHEHFEDCPMPIDIAGESDIHIARMRQFGEGPSKLMFWIVFDGIRAGRVNNAIQIAEELSITRDQ